MNKIKFFDVVIVLLLLVLSAVPMLYFLNDVTEENAMIKVTAGQNITYYSLYEDKELAISCNGHSLTVSIKQGSVSVIDSDCPDKICVNSGRIKNTGSAIVCIPANIVIEIISFEGDYDAVAG